jgi:hypothetical protein
MHHNIEDRRSGTERREYSVGAYWQGARNPRRRDWRRAGDAIYPIIDWHSPRVFAVGLAILLLCATDGFLTVLLLANGAVEVNPLMAKFVPHSLGWFAVVKLSLTAVGVGILVACSRMRFFRTVPGEALLAMVLLAYAAVVGWELWLLAQVS